MATLLRGTNDAADASGKTQTATAAPAAASQAPGRRALRKAVLRASLIAADALLAGLAFCLVLKAGKPSTALVIFLGSAAITIGAWLACLAVTLID
jgi:hypothetical protein